MGLNVTHSIHSRLVHRRNGHRLWMMLYLIGLIIINLKFLAVSFVAWVIIVHIIFIFTTLSFNLFVLSLFFLLCFNFYHFTFIWALRGQSVRGVLIDSGWAYFLLYYLQISVLYIWYSQPLRHILHYSVVISAQNPKGLFRICLLNSLIDIGVIKPPLLVYDFAIHLVLLNYLVGSSPSDLMWLQNDLLVMWELLHIFILEKVSVGCLALHFMLLALALILIIELYWFSCFLLLSNIHLFRVLSHISGDYPGVYLQNIMNVVLHYWHSIINLLVVFIHFGGSHRIILLRYYKLILELLFQILSCIYNLFSKFVTRAVSLLN